MCIDCEPIDGIIDELCLISQQLDGDCYPFHYLPLNDKSKCEGDNSPISAKELVDYMIRIASTGQTKSDAGFGGTPAVYTLVRPGDDFRYADSEFAIDIPDFDPNCQKCIVDVSWIIDPDTGVPNQPSGTVAQLVVDRIVNGNVWQADNQLGVYTNYGTRPTQTGSQDDHYTITMYYPDAQPGINTFGLNILYPAAPLAGVSTGTDIVLDTVTFNWKYTITGI